MKTFALLISCLLLTTTTQLLPAQSLNVGIEPAFPNLRIARPIVVTHAGDQSGRIFVASQLGTIYTFDNSSDVEEATVFFDHSAKVMYKDKENEEGLLGFAFHPKYAKTGEFFLFYTAKEDDHVSVISRFRVSKDDAAKADVTFEEELLRVPQPFWNHNGGTIEFGPDGYLYIALGDGGKGGDPFKNGQNLATLNGAILRIDVDKRSGDRNYAIPPDNPFANLAKARPEIYAYGFRNVWRFSFDRKTGTLYAADVGQKLWEEINIVTMGGNYGWNLREGKHAYEGGSGPKPQLIEPIFEYHHDIGKSITGGVIYRGKSVPALNGMYIYADYVSGNIWALEHKATGKVIANHTISNLNDSGENLPIITFGEDEEGEVYLTTQMGGGQIFKFKSGVKK